MESSSSQNKARLGTGWKIAVWISRILVGATFIFSGWAKAVDLWGFIFKIREYLNAWNWDIPYEAIVVGSGTLAIVEFTTGVCVLTGTLRRVGVWVAALMMLFLLPLTVYIAISQPVEDCGCFGEFLLISNTATLLKNIIISILIIILLKHNKDVASVYPAPAQWLVITAACAYPLILSLTGYRVQPVVDTRPFPIGNYVFEPDIAGGIDSEVYIYEKDGRRIAFGLYDLPDSTWTFVESQTAPVATPHSLTVYDEEGFIAQQNLAECDSDRLYIVVNHPGIQYLSQSHFANELADYAEEHGVSTIGLVATAPENLTPWRELMRPHFPVFSVEDTSLKELVRGNVAAVYTHDGKIMWKYTLSAIDSDILSDTSDRNRLLAIRPIEDGRLLNAVTFIFFGCLLVVFLFGLWGRYVTKPKKSPAEKTNQI